MKRAKNKLNTLTQVAQTGAKDSVSKSIDKAYTKIIEQVCKMENRDTRSSQD